jgi:hypothetical protein
VQRPLLYLGEINDSQELAWRKSIAIVEEGALQPRTLSLFPEVFEVDAHHHVAYIENVSRAGRRRSSTSMRVARCGLR